VVRQKLLENDEAAENWNLGILSCLDGYMNIAMEQTEEHVGGRVTNRYGDAFIRGNNGASYFHSFQGLCTYVFFLSVLYISAAEPL